MKLKTIAMEDAFVTIQNSFNEMDTPKRETFEKTKSKLENKYSIPKDITTSLLTQNIDTVLKSEDIRVPSLFVKETLETTNQKEEIRKIFTDNEIKELEGYYYQYNPETIELPLEFTPAIPVNVHSYSTRISAKQLALMMNNQIINYNYDIQREAHFQKRKGSLVKEPTVSNENIEEMTNLLLENRLRASTMQLNALPASADSGNELDYDSNKLSLRINEGTRLEVLDGFNRIRACVEAYNQDPDIDFYFNIIISNYTIPEAQQWQAQHAKALPWSKHKVTELSQENRSDAVVKALNSSRASEAISVSKRLHSTEIGTFTDFSRSISYSFDLKNRRDEVLAEQLISPFLDDWLQYVDSSIPRVDNMLNSTYGMAGIIYYISLQEEYDAVKFMDFIEKYSQSAEELKQKLDVKSLHQQSLTAPRFAKIKEFIQEVVS